MVFSAFWSSSSFSSALIFFLEIFDRTTFTGIFQPSGPSEFLFVEVTLFLGMVIFHESFALDRVLLSISLETFPSSLQFSFPSPVPCSNLFPSSLIISRNVQIYISSSLRWWSRETCSFGGHVKLAPLSTTYRSNINMVDSSFFL